VKEHEGAAARMGILGPAHRVSLKKGANAFDNSVPPGHNSSPSFRMKKIPVCLLVLMSKNLVRGGDFAIELS
jgi:hypothetical protein